MMKKTTKKVVTKRVTKKVAKKTAVKTSPAIKKAAKKVAKRVAQQQEIAARKAVDMINHPPHYTQHPSGVEIIEIVENMKNPTLSAAVKYWGRKGKKGSESEDLEKMLWYVQRERANRENPLPFAKKKQRVAEFLKHEKGKLMQLLLTADKSKSDTGSLKSAEKIIKSAITRAKRTSK